MTVRLGDFAQRAVKARVAQTEEGWHIRLDADDGPLRLHVGDAPFDSGVFSQVYGGLRDAGAGSPATAVVVKRLSLLPPRHGDSLRAHLQAVSPARSQGLESPLQGILREVAALRAVGGPFAAGLVVLYTERELPDGPVPSKVYIAMPPSPGDFLEGLDTLRRHETPLAQRIALAHRVLLDIVPPLLEMHRAGITHNDIKSENLLRGPVDFALTAGRVVAHAATAPAYHLSFADFGAARLDHYFAPGPRDDAGRTGELALNIMLPARTGSFGTAAARRAGVAEIAALAPPLARVVRCLVDGIAGDPSTLEDALAALGPEDPAAAAFADGFIGGLNAKRDEIAESINAIVAVTRAPRA